MKIHIRIFNDKGIEAFRSCIEELKLGKISVISKDILFSETLTEVYQPFIEIEERKFTSKKKMVNYFFNKISNDNELKIPFLNRGLWTWLAAFYFESICPSSNGTRKIKEEAKYILNTEHWGRYYRHLIAAPVRLYSELLEMADIYLTGDVDKHSDLMEQLASRQDIATSPGIIEAATLLYFDKINWKIKKGARNKLGSGILRRFTYNIIPQFQMTYDLNSMTGNEILDLLPEEFETWKN